MDVLSVEVSGTREAPCRPLQESWTKRSQLAASCRGTGHRLLGRVVGGGGDARCVGVVRCDSDQTCRGTLPVSLSIGRMILWPTSAVGPNMHGHPPLIAIIPASRALPLDRTLIAADPMMLDQPHHDYPAIDLMVPEGSPVYAVRGGTQEEARCRGVRADETPSRRCFVVATKFADMTRRQIVRPGNDVVVSRAYASRYASVATCELRHASLAHDRYAADALGEAVIRAPAGSRIQRPVSELHDLARAASGSGRPNVWSMALPHPLDYVGADPALRVRERVVVEVHHPCEGDRVRWRRPSRQWSGALRRTAPRPERPWHRFRHRPRKIGPPRRGSVGTRRSESLPSGGHCRPGVRAARS